MRIVGTGFCCLIALSFATPLAERSTNSRVENNVFISPDYPQIRVTVDRKFKYLGSVPFTIGTEASGNRYVFVRAIDRKHIQQMFIIQQEGFLPSSNDTYKYRIATPAKVGKFDYQHSVITYDNDAAIREEPGKESDVTKRFLESHGYVLEPELVMSRFARPADSEHKHEIIFFCFENLSSYGKKLAEFPEGSNNPEKQRVKQKVDENCRHTFGVSD